MRSLVLLCGGAALVGALGRPVLQYFKAQWEDGDLEVLFDQERLLIAKRGPTVGYVALPAAAGWVSTGVSLKPGAGVELKVVGRVHLSQKELQVAVDSNRRPRYNWTGPAGAPCNPPEERSVLCSLLLDSTANIGQVVAMLAPDRQDSRPTFERPRSGQILKVGAGAPVVNATDTTLTLFLAVNDMVLDSTSREKYLTGYVGGERSRKDSQWREILEARYWELWYEDNLGDFLVQLIPRAKL